MCSVGKRREVVYFSLRALLFICLNVVLLEIFSKFVGFANTIK